MFNEHIFNCLCSIIQNLLRENDSKTFYIAFGWRLALIPIINTFNMFVFMSDLIILDKLANPRRFSFYNNPSPPISVLSINARRALLVTVDSAQNVFTFGN